ncbi:hypothetical protein ABW20_dc0108345 [Dactylellina cionopaga]|nr:hypothetical protein ABW20_dc0108345 [Dactylellina cionopaga]
MQRYPGLKRMLLQNRSYRHRPFFTISLRTVTTSVESSQTVVVISTFTTVLDDKSLQELANEFKNGQSGGGLQKGYIIAIVIGVLAIIIIILVVAFLNKIRGKFGFGPYANPPTLPTGGIQGSGQQNLGNAQYYDGKPA